MKDFESGIEDVIEEEIPEKAEGVYELILNGIPIQVDACSLVYASNRVRKYLRFLLTESQTKTNSNRGFWADIIILSIITNKMLVKVNPYLIEKILNPSKYKNRYYGPNNMNYTSDKEENK